MLLLYGSVSTEQGLGGGCLYPRMVHGPGKEQCALSALPGWPCGGSAEAHTHGLTSAEEPTDYLAVEQRCARITWRIGVSQKCCYSEIGICNVFVQFEATFTDAQSSWSAPGLHLKKPFAYE